MHNSEVQKHELMFFPATIAVGESATGCRERCSSRGMSASYNPGISIGRNNKLKLHWLAAFLPFLLATAGTLLSSAPIYAQIDISPDTPFGAPVAGSPNSGGRIHTLVLDPNSRNQILYAASTNAGVWKSTDAAHSWFQSSEGIRNPLPTFPVISQRGPVLGNLELAIDANNSERLLFATQADDGRVPQQSGGKSVVRYGGLYVSTTGGARWRHAELSAKVGTMGGLCPGPSANGEIYSVAFSSGRPFVAAPCGFFTNADPLLSDGSWKSLKTTFKPADAIIAANSFGNAVFVCTGNLLLEAPSQIYRSRDLGVHWDSPIDLPAGEACSGLSVVPIGEQLVPDTVAVIYSYQKPGMSPGQIITTFDVEILSFGSIPTTDLGFNSVAVCCGSGNASVFTVRRAGAPANENRPGIGYDVYAADTRFFFVYIPAPTATLAGGLIQVNFLATWAPLQGNGSNLHEDSWSMAFPAGYDPGTGNCTAYASNDGGIFVNSSIGRSPGSPCDLSGGWAAAMSGLHTLASYALKGVTERACAGPAGVNLTSANCTAVYLATGDNDMWVVANGGAVSGPLDSSLGDANSTYVDPAFPNLVIAARGPDCLKLVSGGTSPPIPGSPLADISIAPPNCSASDSNAATFPGAFLTQVTALKNDPVASAGPMYFAAWSPPNQPDFIGTLSINPANPPNSASPPSAIYWAPISLGIPNAFFFDPSQHGRVAQLQSTGGLVNPVVWVVTTTGKLFKASVNNGQVSAWEAVSGSGNTSVANASTLFVNPYLPNYAWVIDLSDSEIKATTDGGTTWTAQSALKNLATNNGEFRFGCSTAFERMFSWTCSLSGMSFSANQPNVIVASLYPGGVAYSSDYGKTWVLLYGETLDDTTFLAPHHLLGLPIGVWYDDGVVSGQPAIYVALHGRGLIRLDNVPNTGPPQPKNCSVMKLVCGNEATLVCDPIPLPDTLVLEARDKDAVPLPDYRGVGLTPPMLPDGANIVYDAPISQLDNEFKACAVDQSFRRNCIPDIPFFGPDLTGCPGGPPPHPLPTCAQCRKEGCACRAGGGCLCQ